MGKKAKKDARKGNNNVKILLIGGFALVKYLAN